ncbi:hypothetical protein [Lichenicoccus sp.]|uniref:hypothetical protein n=1 Tax=Lichenicoccus sp. TaxID=2781899 RepID=UPI003D1465CB
MAPTGTVQQAGVQQAGARPAPAAGAGHGGLFHEILSDLNPLQYIPVVGTIYRAVTGDQGNATLRFVASIGTSFALGGPVGVAVTAAEEITGIDPARMAVNAALHLLHLGHGKAAAATPGVSGPAADMDTALAQVQPFPQRPAGQAYDAETLNMMELQRLHG